MKFKNFLFVLLICIFITSQAAELAVDFGTGIIQRIETDAGSFQNPPQGLNVKLWIPVNSVIWGVSTGYGYQNTQSNVSHNGIGYDTFHKTRGFPLEVECLSSPLFQNNPISPFIGLGFGYYNYSLEYMYGRTYKFSIKNFAQYFTFGCSYKLGTKWKTYIQFKKLGWSNLKITYDKNSSYSLSSKRDQKSKSGLQDLGFVVGFSFILNGGDK